jgi:CheY-like chemotaxis protein
MTMKKILVVEDEPEARAMLRLFLADLDCEILEAEDGYQAITLARKHRPSMIILDLVMPGIDGFQTFSEISTTPGLDQTPVIILTATRDLTGEIFTPAEIVARAGREPAAFLEKPVQMSLFRETVKCLLATL